MTSLIYPLLMPRGKKKSKKCQSLQKGYWNMQEEGRGLYSQRTKTVWWRDKEFFQVWVCLHGEKGITNNIYIYAWERSYTQVYDWMGEFESLFTTRVGSLECVDNFFSFSVQTREGTEVEPIPCPATTTNLSSFW